jgi:hypothetical protein
MKCYLSITGWDDASGGRFKAHMPDVQTTSYGKDSASINEALLYHPSIGDRRPRSTDRPLVYIKKETPTGGKRRPSITWSEKHIPGSIKASPLNAGSTEYRAYHRDENSGSVTYCGLGKQGSLSKGISGNSPLGCTTINRELCKRLENYTHTKHQSNGGKGVFQKQADRDDMNACKKALNGIEEIEKIIASDDLLPKNEEKNLKSIYPALEKLVPANEIRELTMLEQARKAVIGSGGGSRL